MNLKQTREGNVGSLLVVRAVPEPATTTLSLLALAALAARVLPPDSTATMRLGRLLGGLYGDFCTKIS